MIGHPNSDKRLASGPPVPLFYRFSFSRHSPLFFTVNGRPCGPRPAPARLSPGFSVLPLVFSTNGKPCPYNAAIVEIFLPPWLDWLGSPTVCTIITAVAVVLTVISWLISWLLNNQNRKLRLQIQTGQVGQQQQGAQQQAMQVTGNVTINNNYYDTEGEN